MRPRVIVCTEDSIAWECLRRASIGGFMRLERAHRLEDLLDVEGLEVAAVVLDDHFLPLIERFRNSLLRYAPAYHKAVFLCVGEAIAAQWMGLLGCRSGFSPGQLQDWLSEHRLS